MRTIDSFTLSEAQKVIQVITRVAENDKGAPVAIAVVGADGHLIAFAAMDGVMPVSIILAINKAYTAVIGKGDTVEWEEKSPSLGDRNITDFCFTCLGGGSIATDHLGRIVYGIGVSGRKSKRTKGDRANQDHELAKLGMPE